MIFIKKILLMFSINFGPKNSAAIEPTISPIRILRRVSTDKGPLFCKLEFTGYN
jgi:hypothetical protein